jgi:NAD(P)-dependent dehydrogenase (short-subunit alcohol dehydrogenase family)
MASLEGRLALVTGASRGIGRAVAKALAREGAHVVVTARTTGALEELDDEIAAFGGSATLLPLDLKAADRIDQLGPTLYQRWGKLDILVGAAGVLGPLSPLGHVTAEGWNLVMRVNLDANWRLIRTLDPLLTRSDGARVIVVSSGAASGGAGDLGAHVCGRDDQHADARQHRQPGAGAHAYAREGLPRRGSDDAARPRRAGADVRRAVSAGRDRDRRDILVPRVEGEAVRARVKHLTLTSFSLEGEGGRRPDEGRPRTRTAGLD